MNLQAENLTFNAIMKRWRTENNFSQEKAAKLLGVYQQTYDYYEKGRLPRLDFIKRFLKETGIDLVQYSHGPRLFAPEKYSPSVVDQEKEDLKNQIRVLTRAIEQLSKTRLPITNKKPAPVKKPVRSAAKR